MRRKQIKHLLIAIGLLYLLYIFGIGDYVRTKTFETDFDYPLNIDIRPLIDNILNDKLPEVKPINHYPYKYLTNSAKCKTVDKLNLFIVVKSARDHFENRMAIRRTYGREDLTPGRATKMLFFLGVKGQKTNTQKKIEAEMAEYKDIIQMDFIDAYFNNTIKTMMSFRWVFEHCSTADFYLFTDDDMYISVPNLFQYIASAKTSNGSAITAQDDLYAGFMFKSSPHRFMLSRWRVTYEEYPWNHWPPYITAGAYVISNRSMKVLYIGSLYVKHFRFDDIYLAIVAKKAGLVPTHCDRFYFYKKPYTKELYRDVIASHGYSDPEELIRVWNEQLNRLELSSLQNKV